MPRSFEESPAQMSECQNNAALLCEPAELRKNIAGFVKLFREETVFGKAVFFIQNFLLVYSPFIDPLSFRFLVLVSPEAAEKKVGFYKNIAPLVQYQTEKKIAVHKLVQIFIESTEFFKNFSFPEH